MSEGDSRSAETQAIPARRVILHDQHQMPSSYSSTPGGTLYSTTPGGTRIVYERAFLMQCRNSPLAKSPPTNLPDIPGVTSPRQQQKSGEKEAKKESPKTLPAAPHQGKVENANAEDAQFQMDI